MKLKLILNVFSFILFLVVASWILFMINYKNTSASSTAEAKLLAMENKTNEAMSACEKIGYRKAGCYSAVVNVLIERRINGEDIPFTEELCNKLQPETEHPFWVFFINDKEEFNDIILENRKRCMDRAEQS